MKLRLARSFTVLTAVAFAGASVSVRADNHPRTPISRESIVSALGATGIQVSPDQLEALSSVTASEPNPRLRVISVEVLDGESDKARLQCEHNNTCLPFYVVLHWGQPGEANGRPNRPALRPEDVLVRSGKAAVLVFEGEHLRMTLPVLCLQSGGRGQRVRVISKATKKTYLARVTGPGVVTSVLSD